MVEVFLCKWWERNLISFLPFVILPLIENEWWRLTFNRHSTTKQKKNFNRQQWLLMFEVIVHPKSVLGHCFLLFYTQLESGEFSSHHAPFLSLCPVPLVKAPHPVSPLTNTHTHQLSESFPSLNWDQLIQLLTCTGDTVNPFFIFFTPFSCLALSHCVFQLFSWVPDNKQKDLTLSETLVYWWKKYS